MKIDIAVVKGDGVGPEMMETTLRVLQAVSQKYGHDLQAQEVLACGEALETCGEPLPGASLAICKNAKAVLFGNSGLAKYRNQPLDKRPEYGLMKIRQALGVHTTIRPVTIYPGLAHLSPLKDEIIAKGLDIVFLRDIVGGILCSKEKVRRVGDSGQEAYEIEYYHEQMITDTAVLGFELAQNRKNKLTVLDKANALETSKLWQETVFKLGEKYPSTTIDHYYIDLAAMKIIESPHVFDVVLASNLFGDIISDEGTQLTGTPYMFGSAEVAKDSRGIYTPNQLHNPDESIIGAGIVNPIGMIAAAALMLRLSFGLEAEALAIETAIKLVIERGYRTRDIARPGDEWLSTQTMGDRIIEALG